jgi:uncharacterized 2Fe-2S/4Fe-4S cluster protein (DUF4445 family)
MRRWCARIPTVASSSAIRQSTCAMSRSKSLTCTSRSATSTACSWRLRPTGASSISPIDAYLYGQVQQILRKGGWKVTAAIHEPVDGGPATLVALYPGLKNEAYGIACDIGSTTIAMHLSSLLSGRTLASSGTSNPQIRFGEDLMSRVSYVMMNPDGREGMTRAVREALNELADKVCRRRRDRPRRYSRRGVRRQPDHASPVSGHRPDRAGRRALCARCLRRGQSQIRRDRHPAQSGRAVYMLPCIAGHVGADAAAATLTEGPHRQDEMMLLVDVGTNAEIVLGNASRAPLPPPRPPARPSKARKSPAASAPRPARSSASASTRSRSSRATASSASSPGRMRTRFR